jgi:hypothetical protein
VAGHGQLLEAGEVDGRKHKRDSRLRQTDRA